MLQKQLFIVEVNTVPRGSNAQNLTENLEENRGIEYGRKLIEVTTQKIILGA